MLPKPGLAYCTAAALLESLIMLQGERDEERFLLQMEGSG